MNHDHKLILEELKYTARYAAPTVSFEFFPPKNEEMEHKLWDAIAELAPLNPHFVSVTYGAGGSTRERTHATIKGILETTRLKPAAHLTCVAATREEVDEVAKTYWDMGVKHIVALRGDAPDGANKYVPHPHGYAYADELVRGLRDIGDFEISVAAYPEVHPEAISAKSDLDYLKQKIDAGATRAITQYCFDTEQMLRFIDKARKVGITAPLVPGIVPVGHFDQLVRFSKRCGATMPDWLFTLFEHIPHDSQTARTLAIMVAVEQCRILQAEGIDTFHFYTLNRADLIVSICEVLGIRQTISSVK
ncbi:MAG: methylenetetrahydrofolate reductase [NAD(P)H] [Alphaproteobacteria bacterium]|nr:methylenetetrahydrofolate reductase [NAD(P)H] [Alphaproteobacteria bacterium]